MDRPKECYVALLDILGFADFVNTKDASVVKEYLTNLVEISHVLNKISPDYNINIFSDTIVVSVPVEQSGKYIADRMFLLYINHLLMTNIVEDRLGMLALRGGITKGEFFTNGKDVIFGRALVNAHVLEAKIAKNPRVLIDTNEFSPEEAQSSTNFINDLYRQTGLDKKLSGGLINFKNHGN